MECERNKDWDVLGVYPDFMVRNKRTAEQFSSGCVVELLSGSAPMTVRYIGKSGAVKVVWYSNGEFEEKWFDPWMLKHHVDEETIHYETGEQNIMPCVGDYAGKSAIDELHKLDDTEHE